MAVHGRGTARLGKLAVCFLGERRPRCRRADRKSIATVATRSARGVRSRRPVALPFVRSCIRGRGRAGARSGGRQRPARLSGSGGPPVAPTSRHSAIGSLPPAGARSRVAYQAVGLGFGRLLCHARHSATHVALCAVRSPWASPARSGTDDDSVAGRRAHHDIGHRPPLASPFPPTAVFGRRHHPGVRLGTLGKRSPILRVPAHLMDVILCRTGFGLFQTPNNRAMFLAAPIDRAASVGGVQGTARLTGRVMGALIASTLLSAMSVGSGTSLAFSVAAVAALVSARISGMGQQHEKQP